jgi:hypothetical protein
VLRKATAIAAGVAAYRSADFVVASIAKRADFAAAHRKLWESLPAIFDIFRGKVDSRFHKDGQKPFSRDRDYRLFMLIRESAGLLGYDVFARFRRADGASSLGLPVQLVHCSRQGCQSE